MTTPNTQALTGEVIALSMPQLSEPEQDFIFSTEDPMVAELQNPTGLNPVEAVADHYTSEADARWYEQTLSKIHTLGSTATRSTRSTTTKVLATAMAAGSLAPAVAAAETTVTTAPVIKSITAETYITINGSTSAEASVARATILSQNKEKGMSKAMYRKLKSKGRCVTLAPGTPFINSGRTANGNVRPYPDTAKPGKNTFCKDMTGKTRKVDCDNQSWVGKIPDTIRKKLVKGKVILIKSWNKTKAKVFTLSEADAEARCESSPGNYALARGSGRGYAEATLTMRSYRSARGTNIKTSQRADAILEASSAASADAVAVCSKDVSTTTPQPAPLPPKDDPTPPSGAPN